MPVRWFDRLGNCQAPLCTKVAVGILRDERNADIGKFCQRCATARLEEARR